MHYAEIPIPTTEVQGAFSLNIRQVGVCTFNRTLIDFRLSFWGTAQLSLANQEQRTQRANLVST